MIKITIKDKIQKKVTYDDVFEEFEKKNGICGHLLLSEEKSKSPIKAKSGKSVTIPLPSYVPTESWGDPTSDAFKQIEPFVLRAAGASKDIKQKFDHLTRVLTTEEGKMESTGRIISSLILLESFASILNSFGDSSKGFVFEGFLAALTFGSQVSGKTATGLPIEDIIAFDPSGPDGRPASLKMLSPGTNIHGSFQNFIYFFDRYDSIDYIIATKKGNNELLIAKAEINKDNFVDTLLSPKERGAGANVANIRLLQKNRVYTKILKSKNNWDALRPLLYQTLGKDTPDPLQNQISDDAEEEQINEASGDKTSQWSLTQKQFSQLPTYEVITEIDLSTENLRKANAFWATKLSDNIVNLFTNVENLSKNVNQYFLDENRAKAKSMAAPAAIENTKEIGKSMTQEASDND